MHSQPIAQRIARLIALALWVTTLSACGFHLRGTRELPFDSIYLGVSPTSSFGAELARHVRAGTTSRVVDQAKEAQAVLEILSESRTREVLALNAQGRAREFQLRQHLSFRLLDQAGRELIGPTVLFAQRDIAFNDTEVLAKESEEALLYRDMQTDLVQQLLQRIAAARRPVPVPPAPTEAPSDHATTP
ncbi:MAG TPA: LPS assembly lipoprotein LptE [Burkholderiaceae bacterium]|nr:LPS assembly lipoprotein LptE [Burkholderiaceae bacterium]